MADDIIAAILDSLDWFLNPKSNWTLNRRMADENIAVMSGPGPRLSVALDAALRSGGASTTRSSGSGLRTTTIIW